MIKYVKYLFRKLKMLLCTRAWTIAQCDALIEMNIAQTNRLREDFEVRMDFVRVRLESALESDRFDPESPTYYRYIITQVIETLKSK